MEEADKLIGTGKKHLVMGKVPEAVNILQEACGMLAKKYGDTADECGEAFFWCGKALLELARMENTVLGNALEGVPVEEEEDEEKPKDSNIESTENVDEKTRDELRTKVYDAMAEEKKSTTADQETEQKDDARVTAAQETADDKQNGDSAHRGDAATEDADGEKVEDERKEEPSEQKEEAEDDAEEDGDAEDNLDNEGEGDATADKDSEDEEVGNLQLAWEMLELAKVIYKRRDGKEDQLLAAQAHLKLGEVALESDNCLQALEDFQECLKLQLKHLESDSRLLAETYYQLGLAFGANNQHSQAIEQFNSSVSAIKSQLAKLQEVIDKAGEPEAAQEEKQEMQELQALLPELQERIEDATEGLKAVSADKEALKEVLVNGVNGSVSGFPAQSTQNGTGSATSNSPVKLTGETAAKAPISDISHLVRKKRKPDESPVKEDSKRAKQNGHAENGTADETAGETRGTQEKMEV